MSTTKQRQVPPGDPPKGYRWLAAKEVVKIGDYVRAPSPGNQINEGDRYEGHVVGHSPSDLTAFPFIRPLPAARAKAKRAKRKSVGQMAEASVIRRDIRQDRADYYKAGYMDGFRACQRRAKGSA